MPASRDTALANGSFAFVDADAQDVLRSATNARVFAPEQYPLSVPNGSKVYYHARVHPLEKRRRPHAIIVDAHRATMAWARLVLRAHGHVLVLVAGSSAALCVRDSLFEHICARRAAVPRGVREPAWRLLRVAALSYAVDLAKRLGGTCRIVAPNARAQKQTMQFLRPSGESVLRAGDPVWLWRKRARDYLCAGHADVDLATASSNQLVRLEREGYVRAVDMNAALVDTPASVGAEKTHLVIVLLGVPRALHAALAHSARFAVIGVGCMPATTAL